MKSKRRHDLQTNELADRLGHFVDQVRPYMTTILVAVVGVVAIVAVWQWLAANREKQKGFAWRAYMAAGTNLQVDVTDELAQVADDFSDTAAGLWASQTMADIEYSQGISQLFEDRALAETSLDTAELRYGEVIENSHAQKMPLLLRRAQLGLAQTYEAQAKLEEAQQLYRDISESAPETVEADVAADRLARLSKPAMEKWYNWFSRQKPSPPTPQDPMGSPLDSGLGGPGEGMGDLLDLGNLPDAPSTEFMDDAPATVPETDQTSEPADEGPSMTPPEQDAPAGSEPDDATPGKSEPGKDAAD